MAMSRALRIQYPGADWRDRVAGITHKMSSGAVLASFAYLRNAGGEPNKITREDGSYVELQYDGALRLTNELYKTSGGSVVEEISYGYDASGSRIKLVQGGLTLTNSVSGGHQITAVKNAANGSTTNTYAYDAGGRVTSIKVELDTPTITGSVPPKNDLAPEELLAYERFSCEAPRYGLDFPPYCGRV